MKKRDNTRSIPSSTTLRILTGNDISRTSTFRCSFSRTHHAAPQNTQRQEVTDMEEEMLASIEANGVKVCKDPDLQSFQYATASLYQEPAVTALVPPELTEKVKAAQNL